MTYDRWLDNTIHRGEEYTSILSLDICISVWYWLILITNTYFYFIYDPLDSGYSAGGLPIPALSWYLLP